MQNLQHAQLICKSERFLIELHNMKLVFRLGNWFLSCKLIFNIRKLILEIE